MSTAIHWTSADLETLPDDGRRYEIIDGELYMSKQPHWHHQETCSQITTLLRMWNKQTGPGQALIAPGVIFADDDDVAPDVVWISHARRDAALGDDGKLHAAPELAIEVLSWGSVNEKRDRETKLKLYSRRGVLEYWIVDWYVRQVEIYRREDQALRLMATLYPADTLTTPLLPGFACLVAELFEGIPSDTER